MSTTKKYYLHGIQLPSSSWINSLRDTTPASNTERIVEYGTGMPMPSFVGGHGARPEIRFTTVDVKTVLDQCGLVGADLSAGNVDLYYKAAKKRSTRYGVAESEHLRVRCVQSFLYWDRISARQGELAEISCRLVPLWNGSTVPLVTTGSTTIPADALATNFYGLGPVDLNGTDLDGVQEWSLELNPTMDEEASAGEDFLSFIAVQRHDPQLVIRHRDAGTEWPAIALDGLAITSAEAYLRQRKQKSTRAQANGSAVHIKFSHNTGASGLATVDDTTGGNDDASMTTVRVSWEIDNTSLTHPLQVSTTSAIS